MRTVNQNVSPTISKTVSFPLAAATAGFNNPGLEQMKNTSQRLSFVMCNLAKSHFNTVVSSARLLMLEPMDRSNEYIEHMPG